jgi:hypothetical protein
MKSGQTTPQQRGELQALKTSAKQLAWKWPALVAAALVAVFVVGMFLGRQAGHQAGQLLMAANLKDLVPAGMAPPHIGASLLVTGSRGATPPAFPAPSPHDIVELKLDVHAPNAGSKYSVELSRLSGTTLSPVGTVSNAATSADGTLDFFVRGHVLSPGNYLIRALVAGAAEPLEFTLRVDN